MEGSEQAGPSAGVSNQDRLASLGIPTLGSFPELDAVCDTAESGLDWLGEALLAPTCDPNVDGSMLGFLAQGLGLSDDDGNFDQALVQALMVEHGLSADMAQAWAAHIANSPIGEDPCWPRIATSLMAFKDHADTAADVLVAIDILRSPEANNRPADTLRHFGQVYETLSAFMPYTPVLSEFLGVYGVLISQAADRLDELAATLRGRDGTLPGIFHDGAYSGGRALGSYLKALRRGETAPPDDGVIAWVMANLDGLTFATGEAPPAEKREVFGVDFLARDQVDLAGITTWFVTHLWAIAQYVWGSEVDEMWGKGE